MQTSHKFLAANESKSFEFKHKSGPSHSTQESQASPSHRPLVWIWVLRKVWRVGQISLKPSRLCPAFVPPESWPSETVSFQSRLSPDRLRPSRIIDGIWRLAVPGCAARRCLLYLFLSQLTGHKLFPTQCGFWIWTSFPQPPKHWIWEITTVENSKFYASVHFDVIWKFNIWVFSSQWFQVQVQSESSAFDSQASPSNWLQVRVESRVIIFASKRL